MDIGELLDKRALIESQTVMGAKHPVLCLEKASNWVISYVRSREKWLNKTLQQLDNLPPGREDRVGEQDTRNEQGQKKVTRVKKPEAHV
jgi:hypothetical protein